MSVDSGNFSWEFSKPNERKDEMEEELGNNSDLGFSKSLMVRKRVRSSRKKSSFKMRETIETQLPDENCKLNVLQLTWA